MEWYQMPAELQLSDAKIAQMSIHDFEKANKLAYNYGLSREFTALYFNTLERLRLNPTRQQLQEYVYNLEDTKRCIGRKIDKASNIFIKAILMHQYNDTELRIRWIVDQYELTRKTQKKLLGE